MNERDFQVGEYVTIRWNITGPVSNLYQKLAGKVSFGEIVSGGRDIYRVKISGYENSLEVFSTELSHIGMDNDRKI